MRFPCDRCGAEYLVAGEVLHTKVGPGGIRARCRKCGGQIVALPRLIDGRYRVVGDLATTRLGLLYAARDEERRVRSGKGVRVSVLAAKSPIDVERARISIGITHPLIASVIAVDDEFVVLEHLDGRTLRAIARGVPAGSPLPFEVGAHVVARVGRALSWGHERGSFHSALDLDDVWVRADGSVKLFGVFAPSPTPLAHSTECPALRDDVFRLGVMLHRLLTGAPTLPSDFRPSLHGVPSVLANLCTAALLDDISARAVADSLEVYLSLAGADPLSTLRSLSLDDAPIVPSSYEDISDTLPLPMDDTAAPWRDAGAPSLVDAARHRAERPDVTHALGAADAGALSSLIVRHRHAAVWWIEDGESGDGLGPMTFHEIHRRASGGGVTARSLVWCAGMSGWRELRHLDVASGMRLFDAFSFSTQARKSDLPKKIWDYEIVDRLADGGQGTVFLARDPTNGYDVALKSISLETDGARARFEREVHALLGTQGHPNITQLSRWKIDEDARRGYLAFSFIPGKNLDEIIKGEPHGLAIDRVVGIAEQIGLGLAMLHERSLVHRDLKPQNVMIRNDPGRETAVLIDLGIVKLLNVVSASTNLISPQYSAPERFSENAAVDHRSDLYSLGLLLFEMLTGRHPFPTTDLLQIALAHAMRAPPDPRELRGSIPPDLAALTLRLLAKEPADRPASATDVVARLRQIASKQNAPVATPRRSSIARTLKRALALPSEG